MDFGGISFEQLQVFAYPLVKALSGVDIAAEVSEKAEVFDEAAEAMTQVAALFTLCARAMDDGILSDAEIAEIVDDAEDIPAAIHSITDAWYSDDDSED